MNAMQAGSRPIPMARPQATRKRRAALTRERPAKTRQNRRRAGRAAHLSGRAQVVDAHPEFQRVLGVLDDLHLASRATRIRR